MLAFIYIEILQKRTYHRIGSGMARICQQELQSGRIRKFQDERAFAYNKVCRRTTVSSKKAGRGIALVEMAPTNIALFKQWQLSANRSIDGLKLVEDVSIGHVGDDDVLVEMQAASLNFMDLFVAKVGPMSVCLQQKPGKADD